MAEPINDEKLFGTARAWTSTLAKAECAGDIIGNLTEEMPYGAEEIEKAIEAVMNANEKLIILLSTQAQKFDGPR
jgi:hypothetical protein